MGEVTLSATGLAHRTRIGDKDMEDSLFYEPGAGLSLGAAYRGQIGNGFYLSGGASLDLIGFEDNRDQKYQSTYVEADESAGDMLGITPEEYDFNNSSEPTMNTNSIGVTVDPKVGFERGIFDFEVGPTFSFRGYPAGRARIFGETSGGEVIYADGQSDLHSALEIGLEAGVGFFLGQDSPVRLDLVAGTSLLGMAISQDQADNDIRTNNSPMGERYIGAGFTWVIGRHKVEPPDDYDAARIQSDGAGTESIVPMTDAEAEGIVQKIVSAWATNHQEAITKCGAMYLTPAVDPDGSQGGMTTATPDQTFEAFVTRFGFASNAYTQPEVDTILERASAAYINDDYVTLGLSDTNNVESTLQCIETAIEE